MFIQAGTNEDGEDGRGGCAEDEEDHDADEDHDQHPLLGAVQGLPPRGPGALALENRPLLQELGFRKSLETKLKMSKLEH